MKSIASIPGFTPTGGRYKQSICNNINGNFTSFRTAVGSELTNTYGDLNRVTNQKLGDFKMVDLQAYLENKLRDIISDWNEEGVYAISFFVYSNEAYEYNGYSNVTNFSVSYNTESDCGGAGELSEERWNYAFWHQDETPIIEVDNGNEGIKILFDWYRENGIDNIGYEDYDACYDNEMRYIGKGPVGYYELLSEITSVAQKLQESGFVKSKFNVPIPIIIHDLEYPWYIIEANKKANSHGEADVFFTAMKEVGFME